jgi:outer membrane protein assembly factor BamB
VIVMTVTRPMRMLAATAAATLLLTAPGTAALGSVMRVAQTQAGPGSVRWTGLHDGSADSVAASPDGSRVFVSGTTADDYATVAYDAATGEQLWDKRYDGPAAAGDFALSVAVNRTAVFVTGTSQGGSSGFDYATVAYDAATGNQLWVSRYNGRANRNDGPGAVTVSPGGGKVFVTGTSQGRSSGFDYATVAYQAATGKQLWVSRYNGRANGNDFGNSVAVSPDGHRVYLTGSSQGRSSSSDFATIAYAAATGAPLWAKRYNGRANGNDYGSSVAVSRDGHRVFVTGGSQGATSHEDFATVAYGAAGGTALWTRRFNGPANLDDSGHVALVSPRGGTVVVGGTSRAQNPDYTVIAYNTVTGAVRWTGRYTGDFHEDILEAAAFGPDGGTLYLTGSAVVFEGGGGKGTLGFTVAADAATGAERWGRLAFGHFTEGHDAVGISVAVSPDGGTVYAELNDFTTIAYQT